MTAYEAGEKTHKDENFPVASYIVRKKHRAPILAFYDFARAADDIADHPNLSEQEKIAQLNEFEATLLGESQAISVAVKLREVLSSHKLTPRHALDLLIAFRQDASKHRYKNWEELLQYCNYSAAPVGRFVLDVHGESASVWPASDAVCNALQIINHLQDCKDDYKRIDRIYIPQDIMAEHGVQETELMAPQASEGLRKCIQELARKTESMLTPSALSPHLNDLRLTMEIATIERLAHKLLGLLIKNDPLSQRVHLHKIQLLSIVVTSVFTTVFSRIFCSKAQPILLGKP